MRLYMHPILTTVAIALVTCIGFVSSVVDSFDPPIKKAHEAMDIGDFEKAGKELSQLISNEPDNYLALMMRAECYRQEETYSAALEDVTTVEKIIKKSQKTAAEKDEIYQGITNMRASIYIDMKKYADAVKVSKARLIVAKDPLMKNELNNNIAWYLSTLPGSTKESGKEAIKYAIDACKYNNYKNPGQVDTLAAAYARAGNIQAAIKWQRVVIKLVSEDENNDYDMKIDECKERLKIYINGKAYTEVPE
ncbi:MAG: tetratricopeptide repeat protein [bacterium]